MRHSNSIESIKKKCLLWALNAIYQRYENYKLPSYEMRCRFLDFHPLWSRRVHSSIFLLYELLNLSIESNSLRNRINYTRLQNDPNQRILRSTELIGIDTNTSDYGHNQPFIVACRNFNFIRSQFFESSSRNESV